jgi:hypothetical protein
MESPETTMTRKNSRNTNRIATSIYSRSCRYRITLFFQSLEALGFSEYLSGAKQIPPFSGMYVKDSITHPYSIFHNKV